MDLPPSLQTERRGPAGIVTLNRPQALNALDIDMIRGLRRILASWRGDADIRMIIFRGAGDRAFCAGGDVKAVYRAGVGVDDPDEKIALAKLYFADEYTMNREFYDYPKPIISFMNGITMGGGFGVAGPCRYRVASDKTVFAMPEVGIGFFPDVGSVYHLTRCADYAGYWLGLTGDTIRAAEMLHYNLATHYIPDAETDHMIEEIIECGDVSVIDRLHRDPPEDSLKLIPHRAEMTKIFSLPTLAEVFVALEESEAGGSAFAAHALGIMRGRSPLSMMLTHAYLHRMVGADFDAVTAMDYRLAMCILQQDDFYEGIRAALIDRDKTPIWSPARIDEVDPAMVEGWFMDTRFSLS